MSRRAKPRPRAVDALEVGGIVIEVPAKPWCDCVNPVWKGLTRRDDGIWVRACCMRRTQHMYERYQDDPVPPQRGES